MPSPPAWPTVHSVRTRSAPRGWPPGQHEWAWSLASAVIVGIVQIVGEHFAGQEQPERRALDTLAFALLATGPALLAVRHRRPVPVLIGVHTVTVTFLLIGYPFGPVFLSPVVAIFTAMVAGHRRTTWIATSAAFGSYAVLEATVATTEPQGFGHVLIIVAWALVVLFLADLVRSGRERARAQIWARDEEARRRASEERLRIARDLHDVVAHNISLINVQAGVALHLIDEQPEQARTALAAIKEASRDALRELRSTLDILRQNGEGAPRSPAPGLADLGDLVADASGAGLVVRTEVVGDPRPLPSEVELAAYRIVQESLTNVRRHAGPASATVRLTYGDTDLMVQIDDDGRQPASSASIGSGHGIEGMRERVAGLAGEFSAGPRPGGGFRVRAQLPLTAEARQ